MKATIYDVAKRANVSIATVSKVINNKGKISEDTKRKVREVMEELNYRPSLVASALANKKTATIGLLVPDVANPYFSEVSRRIEDWCRKSGYGVIICNTDSDDKKMVEYIELLQQKGVDGLIISSTVQYKKEVIQELLEKKMPVVLFSTTIRNLDINAVTVDGYYGAYKAVEHLIHQGCKKIAFVGEEKWRSGVRMQAYCDALQEHGLNVDEKCIRYGGSSISGGKKATGEILDSVKQIDGIFAFNDMLAIGALKEVQARNISVPDEIKIVGFDNTSFAEITTPPLSSVSQPIDEMAQRAVELIVEEIKDSGVRKQRIELTPELIIRQSSEGELLK